jgi:hypothetical protein
MQEYSLQGICKTRYEESVIYVPVFFGLCCELPTVADLVVEGGERIYAYSVVTPHIIWRRCPIDMRTIGDSWVGVVL